MVSYASLSEEFNAAVDRLAPESTHRQVTGLYVDDDTHPSLVAVVEDGLLTRLVLPDALFDLDETEMPAVINGAIIAATEDYLTQYERTSRNNLSCF